MVAFPWGNATWKGCKDQHAADDSVRCEQRVPVTDVPTSAFKENPTRKTAKFWLLPFILFWKKRSYSIRKLILMVIKTMNDLSSINRDLIKIKCVYLICWALSQQLSQHWPEKGPNAIERTFWDNLKLSQSYLQGLPVSEVMLYPSDTLVLAVPKNMSLYVLSPQRRNRYCRLFIHYYRYLTLNSYIPAHRKEARTKNQLRYL